MEDKRNHLLSMEFQSICGYLIDQDSKSFVHNTGVTNETHNFSSDHGTHIDNKTFLYISTASEGCDQFHDQFVLVLMAITSVRTLYSSS